MRLGAAPTPKGNPKRAPARYLLHRQMTGRRRYGSPSPSDARTSTVGSTSVCFTRRPCTCCQSAQHCSDNCLCQEPTVSYAVCCKFSRRSTGDGNLRFERGSPHPGHNFDDGKTRSVRRSPLPWFKFGRGNLRTPRRFPQLQHKLGHGGMRFKRTPLNHGKRAHASRAAYHSHGSLSNEAAGPARRSTQRTRPPLPLSDHVLAVRLRCGKANSKAPLPDHVVMVGLRCVKANTKTRRFFARLGLVFPRNSNGCCFLLPIKEESTRLAASSPFSKRHNGRGPSRVRHLFCHPPEVRL